MDMGALDPATPLPNLHLSLYEHNSSHPFHPCLRQNHPHLRDEELSADKQYEKSRTPSELALTALSFHAPMVTVLETVSSTVAYASGLRDFRSPTPLVPTTPCGECGYLYFDRGY